MVSHRILLRFCLMEFHIGLLLFLHQMIKSDLLSALYEENKELLKIIVSSITTMKAKLNK